MIVSSDGAVSSRHIGVLFALPEEATPFLRLPDFDGVRLSVEISGMGTANAATAACKLLAQNLDFLIICGFGGGLGYQQAGDLIVVHSVLDCTENAANPQVYCPDELLLKAANRIPWRLLCGTLATTSRVLITKQEKATLYTQTEANAVDMETAGAAQVAQKAGVPWIAVRALTDGAFDDLPFDFNQFVSNGQTDRNAVVRATLKNPLKILALIRLGMRSSRAAQLLAVFLSAYIPAVIRTTGNMGNTGEETP